jgi:protein-S-isoprenylcysteine O-methyltransferase Ste14
MKSELTAALPSPYPAMAGVDHVAEPPARTFDPVEFSARLGVGIIFTLFAIRIGTDAMTTGRMTGLLLLASESLVVVLTIARRQACIVDRSWMTRVLTLLSMLGPPLVYPAHVIPVAPEAVTLTVSAVGLLVVIAGKLSLGRSFGLLPANRGIVSSGCYRVLRHPIYLGYLITHVAFVAANPSLWNTALLLISDTALLRRALYEERTLAKDPEYREYMERVRWRVVPLVF